jgi:hypothetical protein
MRGAKMPMEQITVFLENQLGMLAEVAKILERENINLQGFSITDARGYGVLRIVVSDNEKAKKALQEAGFTIQIADVICVGIEDKPGQLLEILETLDSEDINIDYIYVIAGTRVVLSVPNLEKAEDLLAERGFSICK